ncbi:ECF RNA polymerase sigma factor SigE [termite gut metagenome]|uniref:ECF RNA polymerase sigma factor SigE n=1 Tax=termite gut metagenome TaxID=433724 RepID=A0A5J4PBY8_9ZZZZ
MELKLFKTIVLPLRNKLINYAQRLTGNDSDAEDAVQEVMLKLWNMREKLDEYQSVEALAMKVTHNLCMDMWRRKRMDTLPLEQVHINGATNPEHLIEMKDEYRLIREIIESLPPLQQTIIQMKDVEEYETEEIMEITGYSSESVRSNLSRARKRVREVYLQTIQERKRRKEA